MNTRAFKTFYYLNEAWKVHDDYHREESYLLRESLANNSMSFLLEQDQKAKTDKVYASVESAANAAAQDLDKLEQAVKATGGMSNTLAAIDAARGELSTARLKQGLNLSTLLGQPLRDVTKILSNVQNLSASIGKALSTVGDSIKTWAPGLKNDQARRELPLKDLLGQELPAKPIKGVKAPSLQDFEKAAVSQLKPPKGFFGGFGQGLKSALRAFGVKQGAGFGLSDDGFIQDLNALSLSSLEKFFSGGGSAAAADVVDQSDDDALPTLEQGLEDADVDPGEMTGDDKEGEAGEEGEEGEPLSDEEAEEEQEQAADALESGVDQATGDSTTPLDAVQQALRAWHDGLSKSSQSSLKANNRMGELNSGISDSLDQAADAVESAVADAVDAWVSKHEEVLIRSKRFAKKNFDSLRDLIPALAATMVKKKNEGSVSLTRNYINSYVFKFLDKKYKSQLTSGVLYEYFESSYHNTGNNSQNLHEGVEDKSDLMFYRWRKMAGLGD